MRTTAALLLGLLSLCCANAGATMLSLDPADQASAAGGLVQVSVNVSELSNGLGAYAFSLQYDPTILSFNGAVDRGGLGSPGIATLGLAWDSLSGSISLFDVSFLDSASLLSFQSQSFQLLTLTFDTLAAGTSSLSFANVSLADADGTAIAAELASGSVTVSSEVPSSVPEPSSLFLFAAALMVLLAPRSLRRCRSLAPAVLLLLIGWHTQSATAAACDADVDSDVDRNDLTLIQQAVLKRVTPSPGDPRDGNGDGSIDAADGRVCALRCTRASCATNSRPIANAGPDQNAVLNSTVVLNGTGSSDPDGDQLTFRWTLVAAPVGSVAQLSNIGAAGPTFVADKLGAYQLQLIVRDGALDSAADTVEITVLNASPIAPSTVKVDATLTSQIPSIPGFDGAANRPVAALTDRSGILMHFVANEFIVVSDDTTAVNAMAARWGGTLARSFVPRTFGLSGTSQHLIRIGGGAINTSQLIADLQQLQPDARSDLRVSSQAGLRVLAAAAREGAAGNVVGLNIVMSPATYQSRVTTENASLPICPGNTDNPGCVLGGISGTEAFNSNAFQWSYMGTGPNTQNIGVGEAWRSLDLAGRLGNKVKVAFIDGGFSPANVDNPAVIEHHPNSIFETGYPQNELSCTDGASCPWHGANVVSAAMGPPDDSKGAAGPAGPVGQAVTIRLSGDIFNYLGAWGIAFSSGARILSMSVGARVPAGVSWAVKPLDLATTIAHGAGMLLFASAGNKSVNVDGEDCAPPFDFPCWEEAWWVPCENGGVTCVGALADNANFRWYRSDESGSNYGDEEVDIFGPGKLWVGGDPGNSEPHLFSATSAATPFVAGVAALIMAANPSLKGSEVEQILLSTAHPSPDSTVRRYVNAQGAVNQALGGSPVCMPPQLGNPGGGTLLIPCRRADFSVTHQSSFGPYSYQWRKRQGNSWLDLADSVTINGTRTAGLTFDPFRPRDVGQYDVVVSNICGTSTSYPLTMTMQDGHMAAVPPMLPAARNYHAMAFDRARGRMVLHGGTDFVSGPVIVGNIRYNGTVYPSDETWERNANGTWQVVNTPQSPPTRYHHAMAYDEARGVMVVYGGFICQSNAACVRPTEGNEQFYNDTWEWDGTSWTQKFSSQTPGLRWDHVMTYDPVRRRVVMFGGRNGFGTPINDQWEWDGTSWIRRTTLGDPAQLGNGPGALANGITYDRSRSVYVLHGGGQTWELDSAGAWKMKFSAPANSDLQFGAGLAYDDFGRTLLAAMGPFKGTLWQWDGTTWTQRDDSLPLGGASLAYDSTRRRMLIAGGGNGIFSFPVKDTREWEYWDQSCDAL